METIDGQKSAIALERLLKDIAVAKDSMAGKKGNPTVLNRAAQRLEQLRVTMRGWYGFYALYDPKFVWWTEAPYKKADEAVEAARPVSAHRFRSGRNSGGAGGPRVLVEDAVVEGVEVDAEVAAVAVHAL